MSALSCPTLNAYRSSTDFVTASTAPACALYTDASLVAVSGVANERTDPSSAPTTSVRPLLVSASCIVKSVCEMRRKA